MKEKNVLVLDKIRVFLMSEVFMAITFIVAALITIFKLEIYGAIAFVTLISLLLIICDDVIVTTFPFMLVCCFAAKCKNSFDIFIQFWWLAVLIVFAFIFHFVAYKKSKDYNSIGKNFWAILVVSIAVTLGGVGIISAKEYFAGVSLFYIVGLGFGMLFAYWLMHASFKPSDKYVFSDRFSKIMVATALFGCFMIIHHYIINMESFLANPRILQFQWRNNLSTMLMIAMPFTFYLSSKKSPYLFVGILSYGCMLLSGSRGGMLFGGVEFLMCIIVLIIVDARKRKLNIGIFGTLFAIGLISLGSLEDLLQKTLERFVAFKENKIRLGLFERAIEDFHSNPVFGRGLGYFGNRDIHKSVKFALCWYHSTPFQIIGSFGVAGILAYLYQYFVRIKTFMTNRKSFFNITVFLSYVAVEMMSLVNPGVFTPIYLLIVTMLFVVIEKCTTQEDKDEYAMLRAGAKNNNEVEEVLTEENSSK